MAIRYTALESTVIWHIVTLKELYEKRPQLLDSKLNRIGESTRRIALRLVNRGSDDDPNEVIKEANRILTLRKEHIQFTQALRKMYLGRGTHFRKLRKQNP